jgi:hypothetical protein
VGRESGAGAPIDSLFCWRAKAPPEWRVRQRIRNCVDAFAAVRHHVRNCFVLKMMRENCRLRILDQFASRAALEFCPRTHGLVCKAAPDDASPSSLLAPSYASR